MDDNGYLGMLQKLMAERVSADRLMTDDRRQVRDDGGSREDWEVDQLGSQVNLHRTDETRQPKSGW